MDESYRNRHRAAWEQRRAAEAAEREAAAAAANTAASAAATPAGGAGSTTGNSEASSGGAPPSLGTEQQQPQQQQQQRTSASVSPNTASPPQTSRGGAALGFQGPPSGGVRTRATSPPASDEEALSEEAARRLQAEFDAVDEVRQPDASYHECLLGDQEDVWGAPRGGPPLAASVSNAFGLAEGFRAAAAAVQGFQQSVPFGGPLGGPQGAPPSSDIPSDEELARRLQEEEQRRAQRLRQQLPSLRSEGGTHGGNTPSRAGAPNGSQPAGRGPPIPIEPDPLGLEAFAPAASIGGRGNRTPSEMRGPHASSQASPIRTRSPRSASPEVVEVQPPRHPAPDVAAAAAEAGIQVDPDVSQARFLFKLRKQQRLNLNPTSCDVYHTHSTPFQRE
ncbi:hypothetical protein Emed_007551 [Eimeria media]